MSLQLQRYPHRGLSPRRRRESRTWRKVGARLSLSYLFGAEPAPFKGWSRQEMFRHFRATFIVVGKELPVAVFENGELILR